MYWKLFFITILFLAPLTCFADTPWGVNMHLRERVDDADWDSVLDLAQNGRVGWAREQFNWNVIEPTDDDYNWDQYDEIISEYQEHNIQVLGLITYSSSWASENPGSSDYYYYPPGMTAWKDYTYNLAERYKDSIDYWEIWNEPNHSGFWKGTAAEYAEYLMEASKQIKAANPDAKIVLGGLSGTDTSFLNKIYKELDGAYYDVIAIHPYRVKDGNFNYSPEYTTSGLNTLRTDLRNLNRFLRKHKDKDKPVWITELGWTTYSEGVNNRAQANFLMRAFLQALTVDQVKKVFWYEFKNNSNTDYLESRFGLVTQNDNPKKSYNAYEFLNEHLRGYLKYQKSLHTDEITPLDYFNKKGDWRFLGAEYADGTLKIHENQLKVRYEFKKANKNCYLPIYNKIKMPDNTRAVVFDAKGDNKSNDLKMRVEDSTGEIFQYNIGKLSKKWLTYQIPLKNEEQYWGGDEDGEIDYPVYFNSFILDDYKDGNQTSGTFYLDNLKSTTDGNVYVYKYKKGSAVYYALWNTTGAKKIRVKLGNAKKIRIFSLDKSSYKTSKKGYYNLTVGYTPKLIRKVK